jgi:hypothetical protein
VLHLPWLLGGNSQLIIIDGIMQAHQDLARLQELANAQRRRSLAAFKERVTQGAQQPRNDTLLESMDRTDALLAANFEPEHVEARRRFKEDLRSLAGHHTAAAAPAIMTSNTGDDDDDDSLSEKSISSAGSDTPRVVPAVAAWSVPGRVHREGVSSAGDQLVGAVWRTRLHGAKSKRYHVRREGARFGELVEPVPPPPAQPVPHPEPPIDPSAIEVALEDYRLRAFFSDVDPEHQYNAEEFIAEANWRDGKESAWRALYRLHWEAIEDRVLAASGLKLQKRRLLSRLLILVSAFTEDNVDAETLEAQVQQCSDQLDIQRLWRRRLKLYDACPVEVPEPAPVPIVDKPPEPVVAMELSLQVLITGLDLTIVFEAADASLQLALQEAFSADIHAALVPRRREPGAELFSVRVEKIEHGALVFATLRVVKWKTAVRRLGDRLVQHVEDGSFLLLTVRDVMLNMFKAQCPSLGVIGAAISGFVEYPAGVLSTVPPALPHAPLRLDFAQREIVYAAMKPRDEQAIENIHSGLKVVPPPMFLDTVWRVNRQWEADAAGVPPYGTEKPRDMRVPAFFGKQPAHGATERRSDDGSCVSSAVLEFFARRRFES